MATECNGCGGCCNPVMLPFTQDQVAHSRPGEIEPDNRDFILNDLTPISRREGLRRSPYLDGGLTVLGDERTGAAVWIWSFFYECKHYDQATKRCGNYENRPSICRGYPWYDAEPDPLKSLPLECSYRADQTTVGVTIADKVNARFTRGS